MPIDKYSASSRIFAFLAVSSSVAAVSWAIRDPLLLAIGIPGLAAGHFYSWRRRDVSIRRTLVLLLFMALTVLLGRDLLVSGLGDRLLLTRYLIYGLVLGSFDLIKRRNVMASLVLGGLLLILISELALDFRFLVFPVIFTVLALTAVGLSRIEATTGQAPLVGASGWLTGGKEWGAFLAGTLLLSVVFFLLMPRLTSSQIAQASWLPSRLDLSLGGLSMLPSRPSASVSPGIFPSYQDEGVSGEDEGVSGEREHVPLGYVGSSADRAVMHVRSQLSSYWRGLTLDRYDGQGWLASSPQIKLLDESRREFVLPDSRSSLSGERAYWQAYYMLSDQPNAIFTGYNPGRIYLPQTDQTFLEKGTLYRALSSMPYLRPQSLRIDSVVSEDLSNLVLPPISERTSALAESIVQGASTDYDKAARLERFLLTNYPYSLDIEPLPPWRDAVDFFLFEQQTGYCAQFATAMAVMARQVGLPARIAAGYLPGIIDPMTGAHIVRAGDAHAWVEIHFRRHGWVAFDPTPRPDTAMGFAARRNRAYFGLEDLTGVSLASILSPLAFNRSLGSFSMPGGMWIVLLSTAVIVTALALLFGRRRKRVRQEAKRYSTLEGQSRREVLALYHKMVALLTRKGLPSRQRYQPLYEYADILCSQIPDARELIERLTQAASIAAYDPGPFNTSTVAEAKQWLADLRKKLAGYRNAPRTSSAHPGYSASRVEKM